MFLRTEQTIQYFMRKGIKGQHHPYKRKKTLVIFKCDNCSEEFTRDKGRIDPKSLCCVLFTTEAAGDMQFVVLGGGGIN